MALRNEEPEGGSGREPIGRVGVRELKEHTSEVVRRVREDHETVDITFRGEVVARIIPVRKEPTFDREAFKRRWAAHRELAKQIGEGWPDGLSAVDAVAEGREERW